MFADLSFALRSLAKSRGFTCAAVLVLALGIGTNSAIFHLVHTLLFTPPSYSRPEEVLRLVSRDPHRPEEARDFSYPAYCDIRDANDAFSGLAAYDITVVGLGVEGTAQRSLAALVTSNYFTVLGVRPALGRAFVPDEETPGRRSPVVIVSHRFWESRGADPTIIGSVVSINGRRFTVVGVMPESFTGTMHLFATELWLPLGEFDSVAKVGSSGLSTSLGERSLRPLQVLGRLKPGKTPAAAASSLEALAVHLKENGRPIEKDNTLAVVRPSRFATPGNDRSVAAVGTLLLGMAMIVLVVASLNLTHMLLARGTARRKEIAVRLALGAGRARIVRMLLAEGLILALLGGAGGLILALWSSDLLLTSLAKIVPGQLAWSTSPQPALLGATFGFCLFGTLCFALAPALSLSRSNVIDALKAQAGEAPRKRTRAKWLPRQPLIVAQIALTLALIAAAGLFIRSATEAAAAQTGLRADNNFILELDAGLIARDETQSLDLYRRIRERLAALPGARSASLCTDIPFSGLDPSMHLQAVGANASGKAVSIDAKWNSVSDDYFRTVGLPMLRGHSFTTAGSGRSSFVVVNEVLAKRLWPEGDPIGQQLRIVSDGAAVNESSSKDSSDKNGGGASMLSPKMVEVIGVVPPTRHTLFEQSPDPELYFSFAQNSSSHVFLQINFPGLRRENAAATAEMVRHVVHEIDPALPILSLKTFGQHLDTNVQIWMVRAGAALFSAFGGLAFCLALVGTYGVIAYSVARRTREIGIRMALGALATTVQKMVLREAVVMLASGLVLGLFLALLIGKVVGSLLYHVGAQDPIAFTAAPLLLGIATLLACWIPARRATKVDPMVALRTE